MELAALCVPPPPEVDIGVCGGVFKGMEPGGCAKLPAVMPGT